VNSALSKLGCLLLTIAGAFCLGYVAFNRGEQVNAMWLLAAAIAVYLIAYRFYSLYIAKNALQLDASRITPAVKHNDGLDYVPTDKATLFGAHFAAIAGAGPLVGPVLAAQLGYLPGTLWILGGVVFAGAVQDMMVLWASTRRDSKTLGDMIKSEMGPVLGIIASIGILAIMVIIVAVLALIVVKALVGSPWGLFTVAMTIPIAFLMGFYSRFFRPGKVAEVSIIGFALLIASIIFGQYIAEMGHPLREYFDHKGEALAIMLIIYGFCAAVLPVWLLMAPRGLLSTFLKIGLIVLLAVGIVVVRPDFQMPAITQFIDGTGPVFSGKLFPFLFVTIACGAISGFHAMVSSGTTSKMLDNEINTRFIAYGGMLMESFVAIMALITASVINNSTMTAEQYEELAVKALAAQKYTETLVQLDPAINNSVPYTHIKADELLKWAELVGEPSIMSRTGDAPTLANRGYKKSIFYPGNK
jgi:carbon starvation protein